MEEMNVDDSDWGDWGDSDDDMIQNELDNLSRQQNDEDPLDRIVQDYVITRKWHVRCRWIHLWAIPQTNVETAIFCPSVSDPFLPMPGKIWGGGDDTFDLLTDETNLHAAQKGTGGWEDVSAE